MRIRLSIVWTVISLVICANAFAQDDTKSDAAAKADAPAAEPAKWDEFPPIENYQRVGIKKRYDTPRYNEMRKCIRGFKSKMKATYYAGVVDITDREGRVGRKHDDAQPYAAEMFKAWTETTKLSPDTGVLLVLGVRNRSIGVQGGAKWKQIGLDDQAIRDAIAGSEFDTWIRRYDLNQAVCSVATAIDFKLVNLELDMKRKVEAAQAQVPDVDKSLADTQAMLAEAFKQPNIFGDGLKASVAKAAKGIEVAKAKLETEPQAAVESFEQAKAQLADVKSRKADYDKGMELLGTFESEVAKRREEIKALPHASWENATTALGGLDECDKIAAKVRDTFEGDPHEVRDCVRDADVEVARGDVHHLYKAGTIPTMVGSTLAALAALFLMGLFLRRRRIRRVVEPDLRDWDGVLAWAAVRLGKVQDEYQNYLTERELWQGEAAGLDEATITKLNRAFLLQAKGQAILQEARQLASSSSGLGVRKLEKAAFVLRETPIDIGGEARDPRCPVIVHGEHYTAKAHELPGDLVSALTDALSLLGEVDGYVRKIDVDIAKASSAVQNAREAVQARQGLQMPIDELNTQLAGLIGEFERGRTLVAVDPVQAALVLESSADHLVDFEQRIATGNEVVREVRQSLVGMGAKLRKAMQKLAGSGTIAEPGFAPEALLDGGSKQVDAILGMVNQGRELEARGQMGDLADGLNALQTRLAVRAEAPKLLEVMKGALPGQREVVNGLILKIRMSIQKAEPEIQKSYTPYLAKLTDYQRTLSKVQRTMGQIDAAVAKGHYLAATALLRDLMAPYAEGLAVVVQLLESTAVQTDSPLELPEQWLKSVSASWDHKDFLPKKASGRAKRW